MPASSRGDDAVQMMAAILVDPDTFDPPPPPPPATIAQALRGLHSGETRLSDVHDSITQFLQDLYSGETSLPDVFVSELLELVDSCFSTMSDTDLKGADQARRAALSASVKVCLSAPLSSIARRFVAQVGPCWTILRLLLATWSRRTAERIWRS